MTQPSPSIARFHGGIILALPSAAAFLRALSQSAWHPLVLHCIESLNLNLYGKSPGVEADGGGSSDVPIVHACTSVCWSCQMQHIVGISGNLCWNGSTLLQSFFCACSIRDSYTLVLSKWLASCLEVFIFSPELTQRVVLRENPSSHRTHFVLLAGFVVGNFPDCLALELLC